MSGADQKERKVLLTFRTKLNRSQLETCEIAIRRPQDRRHKAWFLLCHWLGRDDALSPNYHKNLFLRKLEKLGDGPDGSVEVEVELSLDIPTEDYSRFERSAQENGGTIRPRSSSEGWLRVRVNLLPSLTPEQIADHLALHDIKVDGVQREKRGEKELVWVQMRVQLKDVEKLFKVTRPAKQRMNLRWEKRHHARCFRCLEPGHTKEKCKAPSACCSRCGTPGHLAGACKAALCCKICRGQHPATRCPKEPQWVPLMPRTGVPIIRPAHPPPNPHSLSDFPRLSNSSSVWKPLALDTSDLSTKVANLEREIYSLRSCLFRPLALCLNKFLPSENDQSSAHLSDNDLLSLRDELKSALNFVSSLLQERKRVARQAPRTDSPPLSPSLPPTPSPASPELSASVSVAAVVATPPQSPSPSAIEPETLPPPLPESNLFDGEAARVAASSALSALAHPDSTVSAVEAKLPPKQQQSKAPRQGADARISSQGILVGVELHSGPAMNTRQALRKAGDDAGNKKSSDHDEPPNR